MVALTNWKTTLAGAFAAGAGLWADGGDWKHVVVAAFVFTGFALAKDGKA